MVKYACVVLRLIKVDEIIKIEHRCGFHIIFSYAVTSTAEESWKEFQKTFYFLLFFFAVFIPIPIHVALVQSGFMYLLDDFEVYFDRVVMKKKTHILSFAIIFIISMNKRATSGCNGNNSSPFIARNINTKYNILNLRMGDGKEKQQKVTKTKNKKTEWYMKHSIIMYSRQITVLRFSLQFFSVDGKYGGIKNCTSCRTNETSALDKTTILNVYHKHNLFRCSELFVCSVERLLVPLVLIKNIT